MQNDTGVIEEIIAVNDTVLDSFFFHIMRMKKAIFRRNTHLMNEAGISLPLEQLPLIIILQRNKALSQRELSDITMRDKSSILRSINALQKKGLVVVDQDGTDKRKNNISLSLTGIGLAHTLRSLMRKAEDDVLSVFSETERATAFQTIKGYADKLEKL